MECGSAHCSKTEIYGTALELVELDIAIVLTRFCGVTLLQQKTHLIIVMYASRNVSFVAYIMKLTELFRKAKLMAGTMTQNRCP